MTVKKYFFFPHQNKKNNSRSPKSAMTKFKTDDFIKKYENAFNKLNDLQNEIVDFFFLVLTKLYFFFRKGFNKV
jgi:hypothetical protein